METTELQKIPKVADPREDAESPEPGES